MSNARAVPHGGANGLGKMWDIWGAKESTDDGETAEQT